MTSETVLSIIAIIVSFITLIVSSYLSLSSNKKNLHSRIFEEIYFDIIITKLPSKLNSIKFQNGKVLLDQIAIQGDLLNILDNALFYKYFNPRHYEDVKKAIIGIQNLLGKMINTQSISRSEYESLRVELDQNVSALYSTLKSEYSSQSVVKLLSFFSNKINHTIFL